ncbi:substrate-binding periplasmic protein [Kordiimonas sp.]|uniref:substrate-binding periplasmic protein n=1 Tax=Kordiimonas sp. TaxID=1970157 RepID=UPI003A91D440
MADLSRMRSKAAALTVFLIVMCMAGHAMAADVTIYTEDYPPYSYADDDGEVVGMATDRVRQIMAEAELSYEITILPWPRAEFRARKETRAFIYSLAHSIERSAYYDWIAPIAKPDMYLFARTKDLRAVTLEALKGGMFVAVCSEKDASCGIMRRAGVPEERLLFVAPSGSSEAMMILYGRADLFLGDKRLHPVRVASGDFPPGSIRPALKLDEDIAFYLAAGLQVDESLRSRARDAYGRLAARGAIDIYEGDTSP